MRRMLRRRHAGSTSLIMTTRLTLGCFLLANLIRLAGTTPQSTSSSSIDDITGTTTTDSVNNHLRNKNIIPEDTQDYSESSSLDWWTDGEDDTLEDDYASPFSGNNDEEKESSIGGPAYDKMRDVTIVNFEEQQQELLMFTSFADDNDDSDDEDYDDDEYLEDKEKHKSIIGSSPKRKDKYHEQPMKQRGRRLGKKSGKGSGKGSKYYYYSHSWDSKKYKKYYYYKTKKSRKRKRKHKKKKKKSHSSDPIYYLSQFTSNSKKSPDDNSYSSSDRRKDMMPRQPTPAPIPGGQQPFPGQGTIQPVFISRPPSFIQTNPPTPCNDPITCERPPRARDGDLAEESGIVGIPCLPQDCPRKPRNWDLEES